MICVYTLEVKRCCWSTCRRWTHTFDAAESRHCRSSFSKPWILGSIEIADLKGRVCTHTQIPGGGRYRVPKLGVPTHCPHFEPAQAPFGLVGPPPLHHWPLTWRRCRSVLGSSPHGGCPGLFRRVQQPLTGRARSAGTATQRLGSLRVFKRALPGYYLSLSQPSPGCIALDPQGRGRSNGGPCGKPRNKDF